MNQGWVKLHRKIQDNPLYFAEPFDKLHAWEDLFLNANHKPGSFYVRGVEIKLDRGQLGWSEVTMATRWKWSRNKVRRFLHDLKMAQQIEQQAISKITSVITIINYDMYNSEHETIQQKDNRRNTNKNDKNDKEIKNSNRRKNTENLSTEEVAEGVGSREYLITFKNQDFAKLLQECKITTDALQFKAKQLYDYYQDGKYKDGRKIKNYKQLLANVCRKEQEFLRNKFGEMLWI